MCTVHRLRNAHGRRRTAEERFDRGRCNRTGGTHETEEESGARRSTDRRRVRAPPRPRAGNVVLNRSRRAAQTVRARVGRRVAVGIYGHAGARCCAPRGGCNRVVRGNPTSTAVGTVAGTNTRTLAAAALGDGRSNRWRRRQRRAAECFRREQQSTQDVARCAAVCIRGITMCKRFPQRLLNYRTASIVKLRLFLRCLMPIREENFF